MAWYERHYNRPPESSAFGGPLRGMSVVTWLLILNGAVYVLDGIVTGSARADQASLSKWGGFSIGQAFYGLQLWRWFTYQFLHLDLFHLVFNMIALFFFGRLMEQWWGSRRFLAFYLLCGASGAVLFTVLSFVPNLLFVGPDTQLVGASGSIFGILVGCALLYPHQRVMLLFPPIPLSMRTLALVILGMAALSVLAGSVNAGGEAAHLGGAALGFLLVKCPRLLGFADGPGVDLGKWRQRRLHAKAAQRQQQLSREQAEVDRILDKVKAEGLHSLTNREKHTLQQATERQRRTG